MKVVILAGGYGTRISEESHLKPKPMIEIGDMPILWHIMKIYFHYGYDEFIICCGYKGFVIKEYFANYFLHRSDITFDFSEDNKITIHNHFAEPWKITLVDTGIDTMTGGRVKRIKEYVGNETFLLTYGDGVSDVNINKLIDFHKENKGIVTITAVRPVGRFGLLDLAADGEIISFSEKKDNMESWVNSGFMVCEPELIDYLADDNTVLEKEPFETLAKEKKLFAYCYNGFWQCMDTLRDKQLLERLWKSGDAPWKKWV